MFRQGWKFDLCIGNQFDKESYKTFWKLFMPGLFGAALLQINILISRLLALSLDDTAVSFLYISSRLMELPLGIFTIAIVTVFFPQLSRLYASKSNRDFKIVLEKGMKLILIIVTPACLGLCLLSEEILYTLFYWGNFSNSAVIATSPLVLIYSLALPFHSITTYCVRAFYASKDMKTPVRVSTYFLIFNSVFSILLMAFFGVYGLAIANLLSAIFHSLFLIIYTQKYFCISFVGILKTLFKPIIIGLISILLVCVLGKFFIGSFNLGYKIESLLIIITTIPLAVLFYLILIVRHGISVDLLKDAIKENKAI